MKKIFSIKGLVFIVYLILIIIYVFGKYDCDKKCALWYAEGFLGLFFLVSFTLMFNEYLREKTVKVWQIYIPAMFTLFSAVYYFDAAQQELQLKIQQEYIDFKIKYAAVEFKNIDKNTMDKIVLRDLQQHNNDFEQYASRTLNEYKDMVGRTMIALTLGCSLILILDGIPFIGRRKDKA
jgi:hypothetical protein